MEQQHTHMSLRSIKSIVEKMEPTIKPTDSAFQTTVILLAALQVGQNVRELSKFTGYPETFIRERAVRLKQNGIWKAGKTYADWLNEEDGGIAFWCDVNVAEGLMTRS